MLLGAHLEELIQEECKPVGQHLLSHRLRPDTHRQKREKKQTQLLKKGKAQTKLLSKVIMKFNNFLGRESFQLRNYQRRSTQACAN